MADFKTSYDKYIKPAEGGYSNVAQDKGGQTYAGITKKYFPNWQGWTVVDFYIKTKGEPKRNSIIPGLTQLVEDFYLERWNSQRFGEIKSQPVTDILFDFYVNSGGTAIKAVQKIVGVTADGSIGPATLAAINAKDPIIVL